MENQTCRFCNHSESILSRETCCSGCSKISDAYPYHRERSKREDINYFGIKAEIRQDGLCYFEDGRIIDLSQIIDDAVL